MGQNVTRAFIQTNDYRSTDTLPTTGYLPLSAVVTLTSVPEILQLTALNRVLPRKLIISHLVNNSLTFMEPEGSLRCQKESNTEPYIETHRSSPQPLNKFL